MNHGHASTQGLWPLQYSPPGKSLQPSRRSLLLAAVALGLAACNKPPATQSAEAALVRGSRFPAALLDHIAGGSDAQGPFQGKQLVLNIWATWCPPCRREMPSLDRLSRLLDPERFAVLGLSVDADRLLAEEFLVQQHIGFRNYFDPDGSLSQGLGLKVYPQTFVIAPDRTLLHRIAGQREWDRPDMVSLLQGSAS
jgi:thiol-disulfide isomerase/thioredoxin